MIQGVIIKMIFKLVMKAIAKKYDMDAIDSYVHKDNILDKKVKRLEKNSHPPMFTQKDKDRIEKRLKWLEKKVR